MPSIVMAWAEGQDASSLAVAAGGTLFFGAQDMMDASRVFKLPGGADAGWPSVAGGRVEVAPALGADGTVYVVTKLGALQAFAPDGSVLWTLQLGAPESTPTSPVIGGDGTIYVASSDHMHAIAKEGVEKWSFPVQGASAAAIGFDGRLHFGSAEGALYVLDPDGMEHAHVDLAGPVRAPSIGADGTVYVSAGLSLHAIAEGGAVLWSYDVGGGADQAIAADGAVIAVGNGSVRALSPDGDLLWENGSVFGAPTIDAAGTIYVSLGHWVRAYTPDGTEKWTLEVDPILPIANPITIGEEGTLHVSGYNGVYTLAD